MSSTTTTVDMAQGGRHLVSRDGLTVLVRPALPADRTALEALYANLSPESTYRRFLGFPPKQGPWRDDLDAGGGEGCTLVAETGGEIVAVAGYRSDPAHRDEAEVAFTVADRWQGRGLGTLLLEQLAARARVAGLSRLRASMATDNQPMLSVFRDAGFPVHSASHAGFVDASIDLVHPGEFDARHADRAASAAHESMRPFFEPSSVAVIGASQSTAKVGGQIFRNLREAGFHGPLHAINSSGRTVGGERAFTSILDVPGSVDLAVIVVPAASVPEEVDRCLAKGIKALVVISAGFAETGPAGRAAEEAIVAKVRRAGARMIGPNCMGVLNTDARVRLNATFAPAVPPSGRVSMSTQSGALGLAVLAAAKQVGLGIASCASVGNKADVSGNDLIQYWARDPTTDVILMYTEGFGNPRKFAEIARRTSREKPIVVLKAGRTQAGLRAVHSHTGALATDDLVVDALLHQSGVLRVRTLEELFDTAIALEHEALPEGRRVAILTNAGGAGILAADTCETEGLAVGPLDPETVARLRAFLPAAASTANPVDMIASASPEDYSRAIAALLADPAVDSLIVVYVPPALSDPAQVAAAISAAVRGAHSEKPVFVSFVAPEARPSALDELATFAFPERAAAALARVTAYAEWRRTPPSSVAGSPTPDLPGLRQILQDAIDRGVEWLDPPTVEDVLGRIGVPLLESRSCTTVEEAVHAAGQTGYPVAMKASGPTILHKSDIGGVRLNVTSAAEVAQVFDGLKARLGDAMTGVLVQEMAAEGPEFLVGASVDPTFGPVIGVGAGGTLAELLRDVVFRVAPLSLDDVGSMVGETRAARLLRGFRGDPPRDEQALRDVVAAISRLVSECPEIAELDLNPVRIYPRGARVLDARIRVRRPVVKLTSKVEY